jgi:ribosomal protein S18 acetylase RimI-like enzyme
MPDTILDGLSLAKRQAFWEQRIAASEVSILVAVEEDLLQGWLVFGRSRDADAQPDVAEVYGVYVDPDAWGCGTGSLLWNHARRHLAGEGTVRYVTLWVLEANRRARQFYERIGFALEAGQIRHFEREGVRLPELRYRIALDSGASPAECRE